MFFLYIYFQQFVSFHLLTLLFWGYFIHQKTDETQQTMLKIDLIANI